MTPLDTFTDRLEGVKQNGSGYRALCPCHDDHTPSLDLTVAPDGTLLVICRACGADGMAVAQALGLEPAALFTDNGAGSLGAEVARYRYADEDDKALFDAVRLSGKEFRLYRPGASTGRIEGIRRVLYRFPEVVAAVAAGRWVLIVEGEKDADRLAALGIVATTNPMGAGKWRDEYSDSLAGAKVAVIPDNDQAGRKHTREVVESVSRVAERVVVMDLTKVWPDAPDKADVSDWLDGPGDPDTFRTLIEAAEGAEVDEAAEQWDTPSLLEAMSGDYEAPPRGILCRSDGEGLFYFGQVHAVVGEPETAKTLLAYVAAGASRPEMPVVLIDFEMGPPQAAERLQLLSIDIDASWIYAYNRPIEDVVATVPAGAFVVIDATDGAFALLGLDPNVTKDANEFKTKVIDELKAKGCTVLLLDHASTALGPRDRKRGAMGSTKKLGNVDVSLYIKTEAPGSPTRVGTYQVFVDKDRSAQLRGISDRSSDGDHLTTIQTSTTADRRLEVALLSPQPFRPTFLMQRVSEYLEGETELRSQTKIEEAVEGKGTAVRAALEILVADGYVERSLGPRNAKLHQSRRPYVEAADLHPVPPRPTPSGTESTTNRNDPVRPYTKTGSSRSQRATDQIAASTTTAAGPGRGQVPSVDDWTGVVEHLQETGDLTTFKIRDRAEFTVSAAELTGDLMREGDAVEITKTGNSLVVAVTQPAPY